MTHDTLPSMPTFTSNAKKPLNGSLRMRKRACQEFCVNEIKTFEKSIENDVDLCHFFAYVSNPVPHRRSSLPRMIPQFG